MTTNQNHAWNASNSGLLKAACFAVFMGTVASVATLEAAVVSWSHNTNNLGTLANGDIAGVMPVDNWNSTLIDPGATPTFTNLLDSDGVPTDIDITVTGLVGWQIGGLPPLDLDGTANKRMLNTYVNAGTPNGPPQSMVELSQIPYTNYDIYVYFASDDATRSGTVTVGSTSYDFNVLDGMVAGDNALFTQTTSVVGGEVPEANYALFSNLSGDMQTISVDIPQYGGISGFQIVDLNPSAPPYRWNTDQNDQSYYSGVNWLDPNNQPNAPNAQVATEVVFGQVITGDRTVILGDDAVLNKLSFANVGDGDYFITTQNDSQINLAGAAAISVAGRHWMRVPLAGGDFSVSGSGELVLDAANTFAGDLNVDGAQVAVANTNAIPTGRNVDVNNGGLLTFVGPGNAEYVAKGSMGFDTGTVTGTITLNGGTVRVNDSANVTFSGTITGDGALELDGVDDEGTGGRVTLNTNNTYTGPTVAFENSVLTVSGAGTLGVSDGTGANGTALVEDSQLVLPSKALGNEFLFLGGSADGVPAKILATGTSSISGNIVAGAYEGEYHEIASNGSLTLNGTLSGTDNETGVRNYVFSGSGNININGVITDLETDDDGAVVGASSGDNVHVIKRGSGVLSINTASGNVGDYWYGSTIVEQGTLKVESDGASNGELQSATIQVKSGATFDVSAWQNDSNGADGTHDYNLAIGQALSGGGLVNAGASGTLGLFGDNFISPGDSRGTLNVTGSVSISDFAGTAVGGAFNYELGNTTTIGGSENDLIAISGNLETSFNASGAMQVNASFVEHSVASSGNYTLMTFASSGSAPNLSGMPLGDVTDSKGNVVAFRPGTNLSLNSTTTAVRLQVVGNTISSRTWSGSTNATWDKGGTANWTAGDSRYYDFDNVTFTATATNKNVVVAPDSVSPNTMTVSGGNYTFEGGDISAASVVVTGASTVASFSNTVGGATNVASGATLAGTGTFQDNVVVQANSTLRIGGATMPGTSGTAVSWNVDNNGTIGGDGAGSFPPLSAQAGVMLFGGWSNTFPDNPVTDLRDSTGAATSVDIAPFSNSGTWNINGFVHAGQDTDGTWNKELLTGYLNSGEPNGTGGAGVTISEIPYAQYDIIAYFNSDDDSRTGTVTVGETTYSFQAAGAAGSFGLDGNATFMEANGTTTTADTANYAVFSGLTGSSQTITVDIPAFGGLAGFQIVSSGSSPTGETMFVQGDLSLAADATVSFNIANSGVNDRLNIAGDLDVADGFILEVLLDSSVSAASLDAGDTWNLFDFTTASGTFDELDFALPSLNGGVAWNTSNLLVNGTLSIVLTGDFNGDGFVNLGDYNLWRDNLGGAESVLTGGTGNGSGIVDMGDYNLWKSNFGATSGAAAINSLETANVPEPSTVLLFAGFVAVAATAKRRKQATVS